MIDRRNFVLGLDGGGTKVLALAADKDAAILGHGRAGACNLAAVSVEDCVTAAYEASQLALTQAKANPHDVASICVGAAGFSYTDRAEKFKTSLQALFPYAKLVVVPDYVTAFHGAHRDKPGVIVIAGTGSVAYGENALGQSHKSGAYGFRIDDAGSGYGVGRQAIAAVMRAADGTGPSTSLSTRVLTELRLSAVSDIVPAVYGDKVDRVTIASLAEIVAVAANEDTDDVASAILAEAGANLAKLVFPVLSNLFEDSTGPVAIASVGSLWDSGQLLVQSFSTTLGHHSVPWILHKPILGPAEGAISIALCNA
jgi:N-acetylglucosamine kinase-like BadF-type ATPase